MGKDTDTLVSLNSAGNGMDMRPLERLLGRMMFGW